MAYPHGMFTWVDLAAPDPGAATRFYAALFGWEAQSAAPGYWIFTKSGVNVAGMGELTADHQAQGIPPVWSSYVNVDDADEVTAAAKGLGASIMMEPMDVMEAGRMAFFIDPTGAGIGIWQPKDHKGADLFNEPGALSWNELNTRDVVAARDFYAGVFPWTFQENDMGEFVYTTIMLDGNMNGGIMDLANVGVPDEVPAHWAVYFAVEDTDAALARGLEAGGGKVFDPMDTVAGRIAGLSDPGGAMFSIITLVPAEA